MLVDLEALVKRVESLEAELAQLKEEKETDWLGLDDVCQKYHLPKNKVKSRQWRLDNKFPVYQCGPYSSLAFNGSDVVEWLRTYWNQ